LACCRYRLCRSHPNRILHFQLCRSKEYCLVEVLTQSLQCQNPHKMVRQNKVGSKKPLHTILLLWLCRPPYKLLFSVLTYCSMLTVFIIATNGKRIGEVRA